MKTEREINRLADERFGNQSGEVHVMCNIFYLMGGKDGMKDLMDGVVKKFGVKEK
jgi:hypothetical protein